nr:hypothetical protein [Mucilaginibacter sp. L294]
MKKESLLSRIKAFVGIVIHYVSQHAASKAALSKVFTRQWAGDTVDNGYTSVLLRFTPYGSFYIVSQHYYLKDELQREAYWHATYGWHSNGHLMEIGGYRYCIFNPARKQLYLEYYDDGAGEKKVEIYNEVLNDTQ